MHFFPKSKGNCSKNTIFDTFWNSSENCSQNSALYCTILGLVVMPDPNSQVLDPWEELDKLAISVDELVMQVLVEQPRLQWVC